MAFPPPTLEDVQGIIQGIDADDEQIDSFITTSVMVVTALCAPAYTKLSVLNAPSQLTIIATWLAAHLWSCDNSRLQQEIIGRSQEMIEGRVAFGLQLTHHGQQLMNGIDFLGTLSSFGQTRRKVKATWLGRTRAVRRAKPLGPGWPYYYGYGY